MQQQVLNIFPTPDIQLWQGDCLDLMPDIEDGSIDMVMADPPYGTTACAWDSIIPLEPMWKQLKRVIKKDGCIALFGNEPFSSNLRISNLDQYKYDWIWQKHKPSNFFLVKKQPLKYHEFIHVFYKKQSLYNPQMVERKSERIKQGIDKNYVGVSINKGKLNSLKTVWRNFNKYDPDKKMPSTILKINAVQSNSREKVDHPTQKPVALIEYLIKTYTNEGETVLDFCVGSGTTLVACKNLDRNGIGIEKYPKEFEIAKERIN